MFIERIVLEGYRSYRDRTEIEFSSGHNVIVGSNGHGKSNVLRALAFVLNAAPGGTQVLQNQNTYPGAGSSVRTHQSSVEVLIDNSDQRFPQPFGAKLRLKRVFGHKCDLFLINDKLVTLSEATGILNSAGYSSDFLSQVVGQDQLSLITGSDPKQLLQLLERFAGWHAFNKAKLIVHESLKQSSEKLAQAETMRKNFLTAANNLLKDQVRVGEHANLMKIRDSLRHRLYYDKLSKQQLQLVDLRQDLSELKLKEADLIRSINSHLEKQAATHLEMAILEQQRLQVEREVELISTDYDGLLGKQCQLEEEMRLTKQEHLEGIESIKTLDNQVTTMQGHILRLDKGIAQLDMELKRVMTTMQSKTEMVKQLSNMQYVFTMLNSSPRGKWLNQELQKSRMQFVLKTNSIKALQADINELKAKLQDISGQEPELLQMDEKQRETETECQSKISALDVDLQRVVLERSAQLRSRDLHQQAVIDIRSQVQDEEGALLRCKPQFKNVLMGVLSLKRIIQHLKRHRIDLDLVEGCLGCVADLVSSTGDMDLDLCLEVAIGPRLFYGVVTEARLVGRLLKWQRELKLPGEICFLAMDKLRPVDLDYDSITTTTGIPMISRLQYDVKLKAMAKFLFGRFILCVDLETCSRLVVSDRRFNCITLDGDMVSGRGVMQGGHLSSLQCALKLFRLLQNSRQSLEQKEVLVEQNEILLAQSGKKELCLLNDRQALQLEIARSSEARALHQQNLKLNRMERQLLEQRMEALESSLNEQVLSLSDTKSMVELLQQCAHSGTSNLTVRPEELHQLQMDLVSLSKDQNELTLRLRKKRNQRQLYLEPQRLELAQRRNHILSGGPKSEIMDHLSKRLQDIQASLEQLQQRRTHLDPKLSALAVALREKKLKEVRLQEAMDRLDLAVGECVCQRTQLSTKEHILESSLAKLSAEMRAPLPEHLSLDMATCHKELKCVNEKLRKMKATDGPLSGPRLSQEQEALLKEKMNAVSAEHDKICQQQDELSEGLEIALQKREEIMLKTLDVVSKEFSQILTSLRPGSRGTLKLEFANGSDDSSPDSTSAQAPKLVGAWIEVQMASSQPMTNLRQLSGGQKTLVAVALILAMQKCQSAPVYLLDEIDAALDAEHRSRLAALLRKSSHDHGIQFISTTFRRELVANADRCIGVTHHSGTSVVRPLSSHEALASISGV